ncbi:MAG: SPOR domain-containing protein [Acidobacteriota bacterium]|nr:SPOR domain-containing protein [Acidobacteriota bacterium]
MRLIQWAGFSAFILLLFSTFAAAQAGRFTVQLEAAQTQDEANEKVKQFKAKGVEAYVLKSQVPGKGTFFRVRVGMFPNANQARQFGASLQKQGKVRDFFIAPFERSTEEVALAGKADMKPAPVANKPSVTNPPVTSAPTKEPSRGKENPKESLKELGKTEKPTFKEPAVNGNAAPAVALPTNASFTQFRDPSSGFSFEYPSYWSGSSLSADDAKSQRINAGALFKSPEDAAFLNAIWNELDKANSATNDNDLIVDVIVKSMRSGEGTKTMEEVARKVIEDKQKNQVKTLIDLRATFQQGQGAPLNFIGKAAIIRTSKGILLVATFYSKDSRPEVAAVADKVIASVKAPE